MTQWAILHMSTISCSLIILIFNCSEVGSVWWHREVRSRPVIWWSETQDKLMRETTRANHQYSNLLLSDYLSLMVRIINAVLRNKFTLVLSNLGRGRWMSKSVSLNLIHNMKGALMTFHFILKVQPKYFNYPD